jgi:hypothetical protein
MENKLNVQKLGYEVGEPMWVHWDDRYVWRGGHILGECPDENLITTVGYLAYMDDKSIILGRGIENHCNEDGTRRVKDTIPPPHSRNLLTFQSIHSVCLVLLFYSLYINLLLIIQ